MANICTNIFFASAANPNTITTIFNFLVDNFGIQPEDINWDENSLECEFSSKWTFPEDLMQQLYKSIDDKADLVISCLSYEFGNCYHEMWFCNEDGWYTE